ncbi:unnamed protein product [Amoebophrya sp. A120]|nr:unnamed protein product [Amoebophrya sp. A120]|eukprot:GSA120T00005303001.1
MPSLAIPKLNPLQDRLAAAFDQNFAAPAKKLSKKKEAKLQAERIARERQRLDPLNLHLEVEKRKLEKKKLQQDVARLNADLYRKEHEQKYGVDMFTAFVRASSSKAKLDQANVDEGLKNIRQESRKVRLQQRAQFADDGIQETYTLRLLHNPHMRNVNSTRKGGFHKKIRRSGSGFNTDQGSDEDGAYSPGLEDEAGNIALVHSFLDFLLATKRSVDECFQMLDVNGSGGVTRCEFSDGLVRMRYMRPLQEMDALFSILDQEKTGEVSGQQFKRLQPYYDAREINLVRHSFPNARAPSSASRDSAPLRDPVRVHGNYRHCRRQTETEKPCEIFWRTNCRRAKTQ